MISIIDFVDFVVYDFVVYDEKPQYVEHFISARLPKTLLQVLGTTVCVPAIYHKTMLGTDYACFNAYSYSKDTRKHWPSVVGNRGRGNQVRDLMLIQNTNIEVMQSQCLVVVMLSQYLVVVMVSQYHVAVMLFQYLVVVMLSQHLV